MRKESQDFKIETSFVQDQRKKLVIKQWEKLGDVKRLMYLFKNS